MRTRKPYRLPPELLRQRQQARRLAWITMAFMVTAAGVLSFFIDSSQAMLTAFVEDVLGIIPPLAFLIATRAENRPPNDRYPYGYYRAISIAFLGAAMALLFMGLFLLYQALKTLLLQERPTLGTVEIFGHVVWIGWLMIPALIYSAVPPVILGHKKQKLALALHDKALYTDAALDRADWITASAAMIAVLAIGFGFWWADAVAAAVISLDVLRSGGRYLSVAVRDLLDESPRRVGSDDFDPLPTRLRQHLNRLDWVREAEVLLREEGHLLSGHAYVVPREETDLLTRLEQATLELRKMDWRLYDFSLIPLHSLEDSGRTGPEKPTPPE